MDDFENLFISTHGRSFWETQAMKTTIRLFSFGLALLLSVTVAPQARAVCQEGCFMYNNTVLGDDALLSNFTGGSNVAIGFNALYSNTIGHLNTATGFDAHYSTINGYSNTPNVSPRCIPIHSATALPYNTLGDSNTAIGCLALHYNARGFD